MRKSRALEFLLPLLVLAAFLAVWTITWKLGMFRESIFPGPLAVLSAFLAETRRGRVFTDLITSLFRVLAGFGLAALLGVPAGMFLGLKPMARRAFLPAINFFRNLSPLAWIPFAILWFGVGDAPSIFLIFLSTFFTFILATMAAVASIPGVYLRLAQEYHMTDLERLLEVTLPAILPQTIATLRVTAGISWLVVVAAEMIAGRDGLGFAVMDSRNGLRTDILVMEMIVIGLVGVAIDRAIVRLERLPSVRWGYER
jgi:NitT/TauT family transport system permease protein